MKKSAMLQAFQVLRKKPMVLLLLLPLPIVTVAVSAISLYTMPDMSKMFDMNYMMEYTNTLDRSGSMMMMNIISLLASSVSSILAVISAFVLVPPAMELLSDGAAGMETSRGWYMRGLRQHWWKPFVDGAITEGIYAILAIPLAVVLFIVIMAVTTGMAFGSFASDSNGIIEAGSLDMFETNMMATMFVILGAFMLILYGVLWILKSVFGVFLPALADRKFGDAFKLLFSKKGFRKLPKMLGGQLLLGLVPGLFYILLGAAYILITGIPEGPMGILIAMINFMKSWAGILGMLFGVLFIVLTYAFRFCVYQQIKDEESTGSVQPV